MNAQALADELAAAYANRLTTVVPPSARGGPFDLETAYAVEAELASRRRANGRTTVGRKVGFANKAMWRVLKLDTLVWAHMYDDTVQVTHGEPASLSIAGMASPKIEPEIVFRLKRRVDEPGLDAAAILDAVEWLALGFEIIDCVYVDWKFQPADFVAAYGLHAGLVVGKPVVIDAAHLPALVEQLPKFTVALARNGEVVAEGSGKNSLRSPALCLGELASTLVRQPGAKPLETGELVSSGTLTESQPIAAGETWTASVSGIHLPTISLSIT